MFEKAEVLARRNDELNALMADPANASDPARLAEFAREQSEIEEVVSEYRAFRAAKPI
jgi:peptide chain release factor 1